jgi:MoaA/NifB/PqqE/SkfB family radical SAM enzyme
MPEGSLSYAAGNVKKELDDLLGQSRKWNLKLSLLNWISKVSDVLGLNPRGEYENDPLAPIARSDIMLELTSTCNLRCVYCPKSQPGDDKLPGRNQDMDEEVTRHLLDHCEKSVKRGNPLTLLLCGTGETTFSKNWMALVRPFLKLSGHTMLISNFARPLDEEELLLLTELDQITTSLDTPNADLLKRIRRKVDLNIFVDNVKRLRAVALSHGRRCPVLNVNCTMTDQVALDLHDLAVFTASMRLHLDISSLTEMPDIQGQIKVRCFTRLDDEPFLSFCRQLVDVIVLYRERGLRLNLQSTLLDLISRRLNEMASGERVDAAEELETNSPHQTRVCTQPWTRFTAGADGLIYPCCVTVQPIGSISNSSVDDVLDGKVAREFRRKLLSADMPKVCRGCSNAALGSVEELQSALSYMSRSFVSVNRARAFYRTSYKNIFSAYAKIKNRGRRRKTNAKQVGSVSGQ